MAEEARDLPNSMRVAAFLFRRDFRLIDNTGLLLLRRLAAKQSLHILPLFFFNPVQCDPDINPYFGSACFEFLCRSLQHLSDVQLDGRLVCLRGSDEDCFEVVHSAGYDIRYLGFNRDITPFAQERDAKVEAWCESRHVQCVTGDADYTLLPPDTIKSGSNQPYRVFTPFYRKLLQNHFHAIPAPDLSSPIVVEEWFVAPRAKGDIETAVTNMKRARSEKGPARSVKYVELGSLPQVFPQLPDKGGRDEGLSRLSRIAEAENYAILRDDIPGDHTTHLSPHLKFGTISIREAMHLSVRHLGKDHMFTRQLIWREFYAMILLHNPRIVVGQQKESLAQGKRGAVHLNEPFDTRYVDFRWSWNDVEFTAFKEGRTGFPLVDAAVRCLTQTGWCHNRCRMIIANFLVKVLFVDWREGERWYATVAVDYDVANNNGGWLWSSGQGADAQPYFRTFNPFRQSVQHDPNAVFIKRWVPELREVPVDIILSWDAYCEKHRHRNEIKGHATDHQKGDKKGGEKGVIGGTVVNHPAYPSPIVDIKKRTKWVIEQYKKHLQ